MSSLRLLATLLLASPLAAAPVPMTKPADDPVSASAARLLQHRKIQKELKLTGEQRIALVDGLADIDEAIEKKRQKLAVLPNPTADVFDKLDEDHRQRIAKFLTGAAAKVLSAESRHRLKQLDRQIRGIEAFADPAVQKLLALTEIQKKSIEKVVKEQEEKLEAYLNQLGNDDSDNLKEDLLKFRTEQLKSLVAGFTAEQRVLWTSLLGEPVKGFDAVEMWFTLIEWEDEPLAP